MIAKLRLEVCAYFAPEFKAALHEEGMNAVELTTFCGGCDDRMINTALPVEAQPLIPILRIGGHCMGSLPPNRHIRQIDSCFDLRSIAWPNHGITLF